MKKILFIPLLIFLFCGCSAEYNLEIIDDNYTESINLFMNSKEKENITNYYNIPTYIDAPLTKAISSEKEKNIEYYEKNDNSYKATFEHKQFFRSYFVNSAYDIFLVLYDQTEEDDLEKTTIVSTGTDLKIFDDLNGFENIKVKITTNHQVKYHNADDVNENTYTWNLRADKDKNDIQFEYYQDKYVINYNNSLIKKLCIIGLILLLLGLIAAYAIKKNKN